MSAPSRAVCVLVDTRDRYACARCGVPGCDREPRRNAGGLHVCEMHCKRWARNGDFEVRRVVAPRRAARGICTVEDCSALDEGPAGLCKKHATRVRRHGSPLIVLPTGNLAGPDHPLWAGDAIQTHSGMHIRLRRLKGSARDQVCVDCGRPAQEWSYDYQDPNERPSAAGPFSLDPDRYVPRCASCHHKFDNEHRRARA